MKVHGDKSNLYMVTMIKAKKGVNREYSINPANCNFNFIYKIVFDKVVNMEEVD